MQPARIPRPHNDTTARAHLRANVEAAASGAGHPGDWRLHFYAVQDGPTDFTPFRAPDYIEADLTLWGQLIEHLGGVLSPDYRQLVEQGGASVKDEQRQPQ